MRVSPCESLVLILTLVLILALIQGHWKMTGRSTEGCGGKVSTRFRRCGSWLMERAHHPPSHTPSHTGSHTDSPQHDAKAEQVRSLGHAALMHHLGRGVKGCASAHVRDMALVTWGCEHGRRGVGFVFSVVFAEWRAPWLAAWMVKMMVHERMWCGVHGWACCV